LSYFVRHPTERYNPAGEECARNAWLISTTLVACVVFTAISVHPIAKEGSLLPSAVIAAYCTYLVGRVACRFEGCPLVSPVS
jgi:4-hydroxybenzoate polyprenyltransferase